MAKLGRPTEYGKHVIKATYKYLALCEDREEIKKVPHFDVHGNIAGSVPKIVTTVKVPTLEGLAYHLGIHKDTIQDWKSKHEAFSVLISRLLHIQAERLVNKGLSGEYNSKIALALLAKHGYKESTEIDHSTKGEKLETNVINVIDKVYGNKEPSTPQPGGNSQS